MMIELMNVWKCWKWKKKWIETKRWFFQLKISFTTFEFQYGQISFIIVQQIQIFNIFQFSAIHAFEQSRFSNSYQISFIYISNNVNNRFRHFFDMISWFLFFEAVYKKQFNDNWKKIHEIMKFEKKNHVTTFFDSEVMRLFKTKTYRCRLEIVSKSFRSNRNFDSFFSPFFETARSDVNSRMSIKCRSKMSLRNWYLKHTNDDRLRNEKKSDHTNHVNVK